MKIIEALTILKNHCTTNLETIRLKMKLTPAEFNGIISIDKNEKLTCQDLSNKMGLSPSRGSRVINKLISKGYLKEERNQLDKRCNFISLTADGKKVKEKIDGLFKECEAELESKLTKDELKELMSSLEKLIKIL